MSVDNLQAMHAAQAEAADTPHLVTIRGETFAFRRTQHWPAVALELMSDGRLHSGLRKALSQPSDGPRFDELEPTVGECETAFEQITGSEGGSPGESSASTASSNGTGAR